MLAENGVDVCTAHRIGRVLGDRALGHGQHLEEDHGTCGNRQWRDGKQSSVLRGRFLPRGVRLTEEVPRGDAEHQHRQPEEDGARAESADGHRLVPPRNAVAGHVVVAVAAGECHREEEQDGRREEGPIARRAQEFCSYGDGRHHRQNGGESGKDSEVVRPLGRREHQQWQCADRQPPRRGVTGRRPNRESGPPLRSIIAVQTQAQNHDEHTESASQGTVDGDVEEVLIAEVLVEPADSVRSSGRVASR